MDCFGAVAFVAFGLNGEIDHQDGVLLDDADQQDDADQGDDAQLGVEDQQRQQGAHAGRRQRGENRDRVDVVLVENSQHDVDGDQRRQDQVGLGGQRVLKGLRRALKARMNGGRHDHRALHVLNGDHGVCPSGTFGARLKEKVTAGNCPWWATASEVIEDCVVREGAERNLLAGGGTDVDILERVGTLLELRIDLHHHVVLVDVPRTWWRPAAGQRRRTARYRWSAASGPGGRRYRGRSPSRPAAPRFCRSLFTSRSSGSARSFCSTTGAHASRSCRLSPCRVYWNCALPARPPICTSCTACRKSVAPGTRASLGRSRLITSNDADLALRERLQRDVEVGGIRPGRRSPTRCRRPDRLFTMATYCVQLLPHGLKGDILAGPGVAVDAPGVLLREEALGNDDVEIDRQADRSQRDAQHQRLMPQDPAQTAARIRRKATGILARWRDTSQLCFAVFFRLEELRAHHRRGGQRDDHGDGHGHAQGDGELAEDAADDAAHQQNGDEHGDQRGAHGEHRESNLARTAQAPLRSGRVPARDSA